jgi:hypothetical protein
MSSKACHRVREPTRNPAITAGSGTPAWARCSPVDVAGDVSNERCPLSPLKIKAKFAIAVACKVSSLMTAVSR